MRLLDASSGTLTGILIRLPLRLIPKSARLPVILGPSKGKKWIVGSSNHGCWLGSYEYQQRCAFEKYVTSGDVVFDVGANVGYYTLIASTIVGSTGKVVAFEPLPENLHYLLEHLSINHIGNVTVFDKAVAERAGCMRFRKHANRAMGRISENGEMEVTTVSLGELIDASAVPPPQCIKMDLEGGELPALRGVRDYLCQAHPILFLSTHGHEIHEKCCRFLKQCKFDLIPLDEQDLEKSQSILALDGS